MITMLLPSSTTRAQQAPEWERFLEQVIPDVDVRSWTQRYLGYALTGLVSEQNSHSGWARRQRQERLRRCRDRRLGEYAMVGAPDLLLEKHGEGHPTELADIEGKRLVVCSEIEPGRSWAEAASSRSPATRPSRPVA
jgi:putative DNA primase/helicase